MNKWQRCTGYRVYDGDKKITFTRHLLLFISAVTVMQGECHAADPAYAAGVAKALGVDLQKALASKQDDPMNNNPLVVLPI